MDWPMPDRIAGASCIVPLENGLHGGVLGSTGIVSGLSRHGFAVVLNAVLAGEVLLEGCPVLLFLRHLLDTARSFDEAVEMSSQTPLASGALITLAGTRNEQRVCIERSPRCSRQRLPHGDEPLVVTNHYRNLAAPHHCPRYEYLARSLRRQSSPGVEEMLALLSHENVKQDITAQHVLTCPARRLFRMFVPAELLDDGRRGDDLAGLRKLF
jgi:predicted choloylglycine hydrolase